MAKESERDMTRGVGVGVGGEGGGGDCWWIGVGFEEGATWERDDEEKRSGPGARTDRSDTFEY